MIETLWNRHYHAGVTGSFHGDMAHAFTAMLADADLMQSAAVKVRNSIRTHIGIERSPSYSGRKWFTDSFGGKW